MNRLLTIAVLSFCFLAMSPVQGIANKTDLNGFEQARWGMTRIQVMEVFGDKITQRERKQDSKENLYTDLELSSIKIQGEDFRASLWMDTETNTLKQVVLVPSDRDSNTTADSFIKIEESLRKQFGAPSHSETTNDPATYAERVWRLPSTVIEMSYISMKQNELFILVYSQNSAR